MYLELDGSRGIRLKEAWRDRPTGDSTVSVGFIWEKEPVEVISSRH
jgi:hypothetical protein